MFVYVERVSMCVGMCMRVYVYIYIYIYMFDDDFVLYKSRMHEPVNGSRVSYAVSQ